MYTLQQLLVLLLLIAYIQASPLALLKRNQPCPMGEKQGAAAISSQQVKQEAAVSPQTAAVTLPETDPKPVPQIEATVPEPKPEPQLQVANAVNPESSPSDSGNGEQKQLAGKTGFLDAILGLVGASSGNTNGESSGSGFRSIFKSVTDAIKKGIQGKGAVDNSQAPVQSDSAPLSQNLQGLVGEFVGILKNILSQSDKQQAALQEQSPVSASPASSQQAPSSPAAAAPAPVKESAVSQVASTQAPARQVRQRASVAPAAANNAVAASPAARVPSVRAAPVTPAPVQAAPVRPATVAPVQAAPAGLSAFESDCLTSHNQRRAEEGRSQYTWDPAIAASAQRVANNLARINRLQHSRGPNGENLFSGTTSRFGSCRAASEAWYDEKSDYNGERIGQGNFAAYGHFTQMMWNSSKRLGCASAQGFGKTFTVCQYFPRGNIVGRTLAQS